MRSKSPEKMKQIIEFAEEYYFEHNCSPSQKVIAEHVGLSKAMVYYYLQDMNQQGIIDYDGKTIRSEKIRKFSQHDQYIPVVGSIACGTPKLAEENIIEYVPLPESLFGKGNFFILTASGSSMTEAGIDDGDMVVIRVQDTAENGEIVSALVDDEATLKRFYKEDDHIRLHPENRRMKDIIVPDCKIQGVAVKVIKSL